MLSKKLRVEMALRALLTVVIFFNALVPTTALAKSSSIQNELAKSSENKNDEKLNDVASLASAENYYSQRFTRPTSAEREKPAQSSTTLAQTPSVLMQCVFYFVDHCSDTNPGIALTESLDTDVVGDIRVFHFKILCEEWGCPKRDVYYRASLDVTWGNGYPDTIGGASLYAEGGTGGIYNAECGRGISSGCMLETFGVIPAEAISPAPFSGYHVGIVGNGGSGLSYSPFRRIFKVQVSLDPSLLDGLVPADSANCKGGCYYGPSQGWAADPINTRTGAMSYSMKDMEIQTSAGPLTFSHTYISSLRDKFTSPLGYGWVHNQDIRLIFPSANEPGFVKFKDSSGNLYQFWDTGYGRYIPYAGFTATLVKNSGSPVTYTLQDQSQNVYIFDQNGKLKTLTNSIGQIVTYTYDSTTGLLDRVSADGESHYLEFHYDSLNRLESVDDHTNSRSITFNYAANGDLESFEDLVGQAWHYEYNDHLLTHIRDDNLELVERNEYYSDGRAKKQFDGNNKLVAELIYDTNGTTTVEDANGISPIHGYNSAGTLTDEGNQFGGVTQKTYDNNFRPETIVSPLQDPENPTTLDWSVDGANLEYIKDALGGETFIEYEESNAPNSPTQITDPLNNDTKYIYDDIDFPTLPTRIEYYDSNETLVSETDYQYYPPSSGAAAGKVELVTDALGQKTHYTYTSLGQPSVVTTAYETTKAQTTNYDYDELGRLVKITDPAGVVTVNEYDNTGHLTRTIHNVQPDNFDPDDFVQNLESGENIYNIATRYGYDARGNQIAIIDTNWTITRTYYDFANRPIGVVKNLVVNNTPADTEEEVTTAINTSFGSVQYSSSHPDRNIHTETKYADNGDVIATIDPQGVVTRTYYDYAEKTQIVVQNLTGQDISESDPPDYNSDFPDQNVRTETIFDANGNAIAIIDTDGIITRTYYDELNRPETIVQNLVGHQIEYQFAPARTNPPDSEHNLRTDMYYDANGNLIATRDPNWVYTRTYFDALNRPTMVVQNWAGSNVYTDSAPDRSQDECGSEINVCTETFYDEVGNVYLTVDARGVATATEYDEARRPELIVQNPGGASGEVLQTGIEYDANGRRSTTINSLGHVTKFNYNDIGQLIQTTVNYLDNNSTPNYQDKFNIITKYTYDALGRQLTQEDALGRVTLNEYDEIGRLAEVTLNYLDGQGPNYEDSSGNRYNLTTTYLYDARGNQIAMMDTSDAITRTYYDALGRQVTVVQNSTGPTLLERSSPPDPLANIRTDTSYLGNGSVDYVIDEMGKITDYSYDDVGRLITTLDSLSNPTNFEYDANGNRTLVTTFINDTTEAEAVSTKYEYDNLNRLNAVIENYLPGIEPDIETNVTTTYTYDANGNRLSIRDGNSNLPNAADYRMTFTYDPLGRLKSESDPIGHESTYTYSQDTIGNIVSVQDPMLQTIVKRYDELNRLYQIDYPSPDAGVNFTYDVMGRRKTMTDGLGITNWEYNNLDLPTSIAAPLSPTVYYDYDEMGNRTNLSYEDKAYVYEYDGLNRLFEVTGSGLPNSVGYEYYASGNLKTVTRPNGVNTLYNYFDNGWLKDITHSSTTTLASYQYEYYMNSNRKKAIENVLLPSLPVTPTPTFTPSATNTNVPTSSYTPSQTFTPTVTETPTLGNTNTPTATFTAEVTPADTATPTATGILLTETPTVTVTPSQTQTPTATQTPTSALYLSLDGGQTVGGVAAQDIDILYFDGSAWSLFFDGSDVGIPNSGEDINDFAIVDADTILITFNDPVTLGGNTVDTTDILQFDATSLGSTTSGTFSLYFDGSDVGLDDSTNEKLDALEILSDGRVLISTDDNFTLSGLSGKDEDIITFTPSTLGENTSGSWAMYFDGSVAGIDLSNEDVDAVEVASNGNIYLSTADVLSVPGLSGEDEDVFVCTPTFTGGIVSSCTYSSTLYFDGSAYGLDTNDVDGLNFTLGGMAFNNSPTITMSSLFKSVVYRQPLLQQGSPYANQPDSGAGNDTFIVSTSPNSNNGTDVALGVGESNNATNRYARSLIKFDLSSIPANAVITSATLSLWTTTDLSDNDRTIKVYRLKKAFNESEATWSIASTGVPWDGAGASGGADREGESIGTISISATESLNIEKQISLSTEQIQQMTSGAFTNNGFVIVAEAEDNDRFNYKSSDATNNSQRPKLVIHYTIPTATVPPTQTSEVTSTPTSTPSPTVTQTATETIVASSTSVPTFTQTPLPQGPITIDYVYDSLNRLTESNYSNDDYYHYSYDAVGNRKTQEKMIGNLLTADSYNYDDANRLRFVNSVEYEWDDNGNLLDDGVNEYEYNSANQLTALSGPSGSSAYSYNGLGERLTHTGVSYTLDLNIGLTQVLSDETNTYLYGVGRVAQTNVSTEYFLGDAMGSVRQLTDEQGYITLANSYEPYGSLAENAGSLQTSYGFTGEFTDPSGMVYLRARYYMPGDGRFLTRDTWMGNYNNPLSLNRWMYVHGNPINLIDPSGHVPCYMLPPNDQVNCIAVPPPPAWWLNQTQLYIEGLGYFDSGHIRRGWISAKFFVEQIEAAINREIEVKNMLRYSYGGMLPLERARSVGSPYWVDYVVSDRVTDDQIHAVAYGMFIDFERGYEEYQSNKMIPFSGFAPADLTSDHLGFWAYMSGYEHDEIPTLLQCLGEVEVVFPQLWGIVGLIENHEFLPMIRERWTSAAGYRLRNTTWPAFLEIQPIPSGPNTWQVWNRSH